MTGNSSFNQAKLAKNDEFYTLYSDVEQELSHYSEHLQGKVILCNCNDGEGSAFWQYFSRNFEALQLAKLIGVKYGEDAHVLEMTRPRQILKTFLDGDGDFRSTESIELLKTADLVITNPPFSLFREYLAQLFAYEKRFLVMGNMNMIVCREVFPYFRDGRLLLGHHILKDFARPDGTLQKFLNVFWYTNLPTERHDEPLVLTARYSPERYPHFDNIPAIDVGSVAEIPYDFDGLMGVPVSYLRHYAPEQFEVVGVTNGCELAFKQYKDPLMHHPDGRVMNGSKLNSTAVIRVQEKPDGIYYTASNADGYLLSRFARLLIRRK